MSAGIYNSISKEKTAVALFVDWSFYAWLILGFLFERSMVGRLSLLLFCGFSFLYIITSDALSKYDRKKLSAVNIYFVTYFCFLLYNVWQIRYSGEVIHRGFAKDMFSTLCLNGLFYYMLYKYLTIKDDVSGALNIYRKIFLFCLIGFVIKTGGHIFNDRIGEGVGVNSNVIALMCINCIVIINCYTKGEKKFRHILLMGIFMLFILISGSRKGFLGIVLTFLIDSGLEAGVKKIRNFTIAAIGLLIVYILAMKVDTFYDIIGYRLEALLSYITGEKFNETSLSVRDGFLELGWTYIKESPWIGHGIDCFRVLDGANNTYSHSNYIELLFGVGILGTVLYYGGLVYILLGNIRLYFKTRNLESKIFVILLLTSIVLEYAYINYFSRQNIMIYIMGLASLKLNKLKFEGSDMEPRHSGRVNM